MNKLLLTVTILFTFSSIVHSQIGRLALSPVQKIEQVIAKTKISIVYSRPSKRDREIFGSLVPYNEYWRTGANRNTTIEFSHDVVLDEAKIKKGKYSIITKPNVDQWEFILYRDVDNWDVPEIVEEEKIVCSTLVKAKEIDHTVESMKIEIGDFTNYKFDLLITWDKTIVTVPFQLTTKETMESLIKDELEGPTAGDYYSAALYQLESEKNYKQGLTWINQAIKHRKDGAWFDYWIKARLMMKLKDFEGIENVLNMGSKLAAEKENNYGMKEFNRMKDLLKK